MLHFIYVCNNASLGKSANCFVFPQAQEKESVTAVLCLGNMDADFTGAKLAIRYTSTSD